MADTAAHEGFLRTVVDFIVKHDGKWSDRSLRTPITFTQSEIAQHVSKCGVKEIFNVGQETKEESRVFGPEGKVISHLTANFTCHCGEYALIFMRVRGDLNSVMYDIKQAREA